MNKKFKILIFIVILVSYLPSNGQAVSSQVLDTEATNFMAANFPGGVRKIQSVIPLIYDDVNTLNLVELEPEGWILLSSDLKVEPVIGYSFTGHFTLPVENDNDPMYNWLTMYQRQIKLIVTNELLKPQSTWGKTLKSSAATGTATSGVQVNPFIKVTWDQGRNWNQFCPADAAGPGGHVYAGCVAVSMAQAMSVFRKPGKGQGYKNYSDPKYGTQFVNFGITTYYWDSISNTKADQYNSLLLYHCAVAVEMTFGSDGSGAQTKYTSSALKNYFNYSQSIVYKLRSGTDKEWQDQLNDQLLHGRPIIYSGDADDGQPGHAFDIDGVNDNGYVSYYHINWGWSGSNNGYFTLNALNPGTFNFSKNQGAVFGIQPYYYPTDISLSDTIVKLDQPKGTLVGILNVVDEATDNSYNFKLICDSAYTGTKWECNYILDGSSVKTGRIFTAMDKNTDTISIALIDKYNNTLNKKIVLKAGNSLTGFSLNKADHNDDATLYPNPATDRIFISQKSGMDIISIRIYSISGKLIQQIHNPDFAKGIQISSLKKGFYILESELANHKLIYKRFIRQ